MYNKANYEFACKPDSHFCYFCSFKNVGLYLQLIISLVVHYFIYHLCCTQIEKVRIFPDESEECGIGRPSNQRLHFTKLHPQSLTHIQKIRSIPFIPTLTCFPPDENSNREKFAMFMLILFKPFEDICQLKDGKQSWEEAYDEFKVHEKHQQHIFNILEMHSGLAEKKQIDDARHDDEDDNESSHVIEDDTYYCTEDEEEFELWLEENLEISSKSTNDGTSELVDTICNSKKLDVPTTISQSKVCNGSESEHVKTSTMEKWKSALDQQRAIAIAKTNVMKQTHFSLEEAQKIIEPVISMPNMRDQDVLEHVKKIFGLNVKQEKAFRIIAQNVLNRLNGVAVEQKLVYLGGDGGTGKSQVVKALKYLHEMLGIEYALKVSAYTGTAAAEIKGSTMCSLAQISRQVNKKTDRKKLENTWESVNTLIIDEVSMISCSFLAKLHKQLVNGKNTSTTVATIRFKWPNLTWSLSATFKTTYYYSLIDKGLNKHMG